MGDRPTDSRRLRLALLAFVLVNAAGVDLALSVLAPPRSDERRRSPLTTRSEYTREYLLQKSSFDSWRPMRAALAYLHEEHERPVYQALFFEQGVKFQYAPTSLLLMDPFAALPNRFFNQVSWVGVLAIALMTGSLFARARRDAGSEPPPADVRRRLAALVADWAIALLFALTFYPLLRGYRLGQIQTWIDVLFCGVVLAWTAGRPTASGALAGLACVIKPQLGLLVVWAALRRRRRFVAGWLVVAGCAAAISLWRYGLDDHLDYLKVLSFIGQHGESYKGNQSLNGLLHRALFNGNNLLWRPHEFAPYHAGVFVASTVGSLLLIAFALFSRREGANVLDLCLAALAFTIASPIVWVHHYGITLPMFAVTLPAILAGGAHRRRDVALLALSFALIADKLDVVDRTALSHWNVLQSHVFAGGLLLLWLLHARRASDPVRPAAVAA